MEVNVIADDTDVLILLMYHWKESMEDVYFMSQPKKSQKKGVQIWRIRDQSWKIVDIPPFVYSCLEWMRHHLCNIWAGKN